MFLMLVECCDVFLFYFLFGKHSALLQCFKTIDKFIASIQMFLNNFFCWSVQDRCRKMQGSVQYCTNEISFWPHFWCSFKFKFNKNKNNISPIQDRVSSKDRISHCTLYLKSARLFSDFYWIIIDQLCSLLVPSNGVIRTTFQLWA
jgi:hypothetical protein